MNATIISGVIQHVEADLSTGYILGAVIALLIIGFLFYTLIRPEKF
jgi:K+-transporting ATPase KdpF subunit